MTKTNCSVNSIQDSFTTTSTISGYSLPISKYYLNFGNSSQNLTTTTSEISGLNVQLTNQGIYEIRVNFVEDLSAVTASVPAANYSFYQLYQGTSSWTAISNTERLGTNISTLTSAITGINSKTSMFSWIVNNNTTNNIIKLYGKINSTVTGNWSIISGTTGRSMIMARLIA